MQISTTARFRVALEIAPEDMDPVDSFEREDDIEAVRNGDVEWFCAHVVVYLDERPVGDDSLGGCAYESVKEFYTSHRDPDPTNRNCTIMRLARAGSVDAKYSICHYFPDMVRQAIRDARRTLCNAPELRCA